MAPAAARPPPSLLQLLLLPLLLSRAPAPVTANDAPEVTNIPDGDEFEKFAEICMKEANVTEEDVHAAFEEDPDHAPQILKCIWGCMYRKIGLLVDGQVSDDLPPGVLSDRAQEYEHLKANCGDKVAEAPNECEKGAVLRDCAVEVTTATATPA